MALSLACSRGPAPPSAAPDLAPPSASAAACTLATPLVPGVPGSPGHPIPSPINPNGNSELAALMRAMQADLKATRAQILAGQPRATLLPRHQRIRCSWPTNPGDRNPSFDASAQVYLAGIAALDAADAASATTRFDGALDGCRACHEKTCSGALVAIEALRLAPSSKAR